MAQQKKKLSKSAKAALKILEDSNLLKAAKRANEAKVDLSDKQSVVSPKTNAANKMRPEKKRG
ncbi:MAG: hypothetical protein M3033_03940 [Acidobacteriota bacterium]|nr:hypothetical protein [Acidobacteriota bacterium]